MKALKVSCKAAKLNTKFAMYLFVFPLRLCER